MEIPFNGELSLAQIATLIVTAFVIPMLGKLLKAVDLWLEAKSSQVKAKAESENNDRYVTIAQRLSTDIVEYLNTTMVNDMKAAAEDGHLSDEEVAQITKKALDSVANMLGERGIEALEKTFGNPQAIIKMWISNATENSKLSALGSGITSSQAAAIYQETYSDEPQPFANPSPEDEKRFLQGEEQNFVADDNHQL